MSFSLAYHLARNFQGVIRLKMVVKGEVFYLYDMEAFLTILFVIMYSTGHPNASPVNMYLI